MELPDIDVMIGSLILEHLILEMPDLIPLLLGLRLHLLVLDPEMLIFSL